MRTLLRDIDPGMVVTLDERGMNGHPDHVMTHAVSRKGGSDGFHCRGA
jgi:LmbE family N-acetylglucosaminyl deacetylase